MEETCGTMRSKIMPFKEDLISLQETWFRYYEFTFLRAESTATKFYL